MLHQNLDRLREQEVFELVRLVTALEHRLTAADGLPAVVKRSGSDA